MLIRVRKTEAKRDSWVKPDALDYCLECWAVWMGGDADRDLRAKASRGLEGEGDGRGVDLHEAQHANDNRVAAATDAMIDSLSRLHIWAIYRTCSVGAPWRFPNADLVSVAIEARGELARKLKNNVCTAVLF